MSAKVVRAWAGRSARSMVLTPVGTAEAETEAGERDGAALGAGLSVRTDVQAVSATSRTARRAARGDEITVRHVTRRHPRSDPADTPGRVL
ncbi:hypothetical protein GCM10010468_33210 [Actinocorallia longicatena]|uniref:Uncharacterized protein n=1 Tax=Actinocorallia longicatena TaxID=111803 RepID=A0ABP6QFD1_9ACTN